MTHRHAVLPEVESRLAELDAYFDQQRAWARISRLRGHRWSRWHDRRGRPELTAAEEIRNQLWDADPPRAAAADFVR